MSTNFTIDDSSPFILYQGSWVDTNTSDPENQQYSQTTYHFTQSVDASASFKFNGTGVYLYGAKRVDYGLYQVELDGQVTTGNGFASPEVFQAPLFGKSGLSNGEHQVTLRNAGAPLGLDLDYAVITTEGESAGLLSKVDDASAAFSFDEGQWDNSANDFIDQYFDSTMHRTNTLNASARISFQGSTVNLFGATSRNHGAFSVSLDGAAPVTLNGTAPGFRPNMLLYFFDGLSDDNHTLTVTNLAGGANGFLDLDYIEVLSGTASPPSSAAASAASVSAPASTSAGSLSATQASSSVPSSVAAASSSPAASGGSGPIVVVIVLIIIILVSTAGSLLWLALRHTHKRRRGARQPDVEAPRKGSLLDKTRESAWAHRTVGPHAAQQAAGLADPLIDPPMARAFALPPVAERADDDPFSDAHSSSPSMRSPGGGDVLPSYASATGANSEHSLRSSDRKLVVVTDSEPTSPSRSSQSGL